MNDKEHLHKIKENILGLSYAMDDAPYMGFSRGHIDGVNFAINKILKGTEITLESIHEEHFNEK